MQRLSVDQRFDRYTIVRLLGGGISGESYEVEDMLLQRKVTLKLIHPWSPLSDAGRRQFFRSMQGMSFITHSSLAAIVDYGEVDRQLYVVRQYSPSGSLLNNDGRLWYPTPLPTFDATNHIQQIAYGLHALHASGYAHGAITLSNLLVLYAPVEDARPSITPLLLADPGSTDLVRNFGQPQRSVLPVTAAPEQARKLASPASDQYALASVLYFWLVGRFPFLGSEEEVLQKKLTEAFIPLTSLHTAFTLEQDSVIRRALSAYPERRFPSMLAFAEALQSAFESAMAPTSTTAIAQEPPAIPKIVPSPIAPEPLPPPGPDVPQPLPEPVPTPPIEPVPPLPDPAPVTEPAITPSPAPEGPIPPAPDIPQPLPEPFEPPQPATLPPEEPVQGMTGRPSLRIASIHTDASREIVLPQRTLSIGRAGSSDILLDDDPLASRHHALLHFKEDRYSITDQRSANGVFINGEQIVEGVEYMLTNGDMVTIGQHEIVFTDGVKKRL